MDYQAVGSVEKIARVELLFRIETGRERKTKGFALLRLWAHRSAERRKMRRDLPDLTPEILKDFGLTRAQAQKLARTPFWRPLP